jgi:hypothetical protein
VPVENSCANGRLRKRNFALLVFGLLALFGPREATADTEPLSRSEKTEFNYAFATRLGSGVYTISGRTLQVYRLPLSVTFRPEEPEDEGNRKGWRFTFPVTFGFYDFNATDILESGLPQNVSTLSLIPGAEFFLPVTSNWLLKPYVEAGKVWDRSGNADSAVYSAGVWSRADFRAGHFDLSLGNGLGYTVVDPSSVSGSDALADLETAFEARHVLGRDGQGKVDCALYLVQHLYFEKPDYPLDTGGGSGLLGQYEVGMTLGGPEPHKIWKIPLPRVGVGYLFGQDLSAFRLVIGSPSLSLQR